MTKINDALWPGENYLVCYLNQFGREQIVQSESTDEHAEYSMDILNEQERNNARREKYYWRSLKKGEVLPRERKYYA
jgi:hypothetical protein